MSISVIICTYNRANILSFCLNSLLTQNDLDFEVVVVNNNSSDNTHQLISSYSNKFTQLKNIHETKQGLSVARNRGAKEASNDWLIYLDDDGIALPNFVEEAKNTILNFPFLCFGGRYTAWHKSNKPKWLSPKFGSSEVFTPHTSIINNHQYISGGIFAIHRPLLLKLKGFPENVGMNGNQIGYGEETILQQRLRQYGHKIGYNPNFIMRHLVGEHKYKLSWHLNSVYAWNKQMNIVAEKYNITKLIRDIFYTMRTSFFPLLKKFLTTKKYYIQNFTLDFFSPIFGLIGRYKKNNHL